MGNRAVWFQRLSQHDSPANRCFSPDRCCLTTLVTDNPCSHEQEWCWTGLRLERCGCESGVAIHFPRHHRLTEPWSRALLLAKCFCFQTESARATACDGIGSCENFLAKKDVDS